ncbi:MAG: Na+/H+ antiporter NhaC family protein [Cyanobacteria bacterium Co-bin13]|nr:Na+/H+ antiporter NhaC family protein [Cyanobacteria bacterium Co-bin13]
MDILLALGISAAGLVTTVLRGGWIFYPLLLTLLLLGGLYWRRGVGFSQLVKMMQAGIGKSLGVMSILLLIGALIAAWMAAGTVPALVYYGLQLIQPRLFILSAFVLTGLVSMLIGTSFGAVGTLGVALMIMARGSAIDQHLVAGAIIAGAYVGDRCSPLSSSAHLVATLTGTPLYRNLRVMMVTSLAPLAASLAIYWGLSWRNPLQTTDSPIQAALAEAFDLRPGVLLPAIAILLMVALRVPVKRTLLISLGLAMALALGLQGYAQAELAQMLVVGFRIDAPAVLAPLLQGGGLLPMARVCLVVVVSTALAGLLVGTQTLALVERWLGRLRSRRSLFVGTLLVSLLTAAYGCTQTIAILLTHQLIEPHYGRVRLNPEQAALDLENTAVVLSPLVPWNIAGLVPATLLMTDAGFIPYAVYLYLLPLFMLIAHACRGGRDGYSARNFVQDPL